MATEALSERFGSHFVGDGCQSRSVGFYVSPNPLQRLIKHDLWEGLRSYGLPGLRISDSVHRAAERLYEHMVVHPQDQPPLRSILAPDKLDFDLYPAGTVVKTTCEYQVRPDGVLSLPVGRTESLGAGRRTRALPTPYGLEIRGELQRRYGVIVASPDSNRQLMVSFCYDDLDQIPTSDPQHAIEVKPIRLGEWDHRTVYPGGWLGWFDPDKQYHVFGRMVLAEVLAYPGPSNRLARSSASAVA